MIKIADLLIDWQNDSTDFVRGFSTEDTGKKILSMTFGEIMPECHGIQYTDCDHMLKTQSGQLFCADSDWDKAVAYFTPESDNDYALPLAALCAKFAYYNTLLFHASLVDFNGYGVLFTGPSGVGKTTQAQLWDKYLSAEIVNGDKAFIRKVDGEFYAYGLPWKGSSDYCLNKKLPLKGIIALSQGEENKISKSDLSSAENLMPHIFLPHWDEKCLVRSLDTFDDLIKNLSVWTLECRPDEEAVKMAFSALFGVNKDIT